MITEVAVLPTVMETNPGIDVVRVGRISVVIILISPKAVEG